MSSKCPYCHNVRALLIGHVYCSHHGPPMETLRSGTMLYRGPKVESTEHVSRLSVRTSLHGEYYLKAGSREFRVRPGAFVLMNQGQHYKTALGGDQGGEALMVLFRPGLAGDVYRSRITDPQRLLDDPWAGAAQPIEFFEHQYALTPEMQKILSHLRQAMDFAGPDELDLDTLYGALLEQLLQMQLRMYHKMEMIPMVKASTRAELYRRLNIAREYMEAHYSRNIGLEDAAREACLSPYHFLRLFRQVFDITPHRFLTQKRLEAAQQLLRGTHLPVNEICLRVGFTDPSSFGRLFRRETGLSPATWRQAHQLMTPAALIA